MRDVLIAKVTLNIGVGKSDDMMKKGLKLLSKLSNVKPVKTSTSKRIPGFGLRPGLAIGCKTTIRRGAEELLRKLLVAKEGILLEKCFDKQGSFSFGIAEYIDIPGLEYDPDLKIMGLEVAVTLERKGFRIKRRKISPNKIGIKHKITKEEAMQFITDKFGVTVE